MDIQWYPGHMAKAKREIEEKLKVVDIAFVLLDARIPLSSLNPVTMEILKNKSKLLILTKSDMADNIQTKLWLDYFKNQGSLAVAIDSLSGQNIKKIETLSKEVLKEKLLKDLKRGLKPRPIRAIIVGIPNVGKSTLINKLAGKKVANVGNMPGVTKAQQWIRLNESIDLLDTPGVLWPKFDDKKVGIHLALTGAIKDEILPKEDLVFYLIDFFKENYTLMFSKRYDIMIDNTKTNIEIIEEIGLKRGIKKDDYERIYDIILNDFKNARIGKITLDKI